MAGVTKSKTITQIKKPQLTKSPSETSKSERSRSGFNKTMVEYRPIYSHYFAIQLYDMLNATLSYTNELVILRDELRKLQDISRNDRFTETTLSSFICHALQMFLRL